MALNPAYKSSDEADRGQVVSRQLVVAGRDTSEVRLSTAIFTFLMNEQKYESLPPDLKKGD